MFAIGDSSVDERLHNIVHMISQPMSRLIRLPMKLIKINEVVREKRREIND